MRTEIDALNQEFQAAFRSGNSERLAAVYTENGNAFPPNGPTVTGRENIQAFWKSVLDMGISEAKLTTVELEQFDDTVNELGEFVLQASDGSVADSGRYIVIWKKENGAWRWHHDIWNSSNPAS